MNLVAVIFSLGELYVFLKFKSILESEIREGFEFNNFV